MGTKLVKSLTGFFSKPGVITIGSPIISGVICAALVWFFFSREEPEIEFAAYFPSDSAVVFKSNDTFGWDGEKYAHNLRDLFAAIMISSPIVKEFALQNGYVAGTHFPDIEKKIDASISELEKVDVILPVIFRISNKGNRDTTIVNVTIELPTVSKGTLVLKNNAPIDLHVSRDQVEKISTSGLAIDDGQGIRIPFYQMLDDALLEFMLEIAKIDSDEEEFLRAKSYYDFLRAGPRKLSGEIINLESEAFITLEDQHGNFWPAKIDLRPARELLRKAFLSAPPPTPID